VRRLGRRALVGLAVVCGAAAVWSAAAGGQSGPPSAPSNGGRPPATVGAGPASSPATLARGRALYVSGCSSCHGIDLRGKRGVAPSLRGVGAAAADFYLSTGRMPLDSQQDEPLRARPAYPPADIAALDAYVGSFGGPPIPSLDPSRGALNAGMHAFTDHCAGCHQIVGRGGIVTGASVPNLTKATPRQIAEAVRIGPYLMPQFSVKAIDDPTLTSIARYVLYTRHPKDYGGWAIGHLGPIPEGMVAWLLAGGLLIGVALIIGERAPR
jgi:ubiquinol-cytochrome c reductase cytochrome c subunit